jgi:hypothetical protein
MSNNDIYQTLRRRQTVEGNKYMTIPLHFLHWATAAAAQFCMDAALACSSESTETTHLENGASRTLRKEKPREETLKL